MKSTPARAAVYGLAAVIALPLMGHWRAASAQAPSFIQIAQAAPAPAYAPQELDQILAPIALYPDPLLSQILMAATYPIEVIGAARWVQDPNNARLRGDQLAAALEQQDWDPSVKSLVPFPQILEMMNSKLDWMQALGNAFLAQQADVMDSVQQLRAQAQAAGTLRSTPQETVSALGQTITIVPANPQVVYVPYYNPVYVYGAWPYPAYPPVYFPPWPGYGYVPGPGVFFGIGFGIIDLFWGWDSWDWDHHRIHIDADRFNRINNYVIVHNDRPRFSGDSWQHDPYHRRGVPYRDPNVRAQYQRATSGSSDARRDFRGYDNRNRNAPAAAAPTPALRGGAPTVGRRAEAPAPERTAPAPRQDTARQAAPSGVPRTGETERSRQPEKTRGATPPSGPGVASAPPAPRATPAPAPTPAPRAATPRAAAPPVAPARPAPPAFSGFGKGSDAKAQSQRGQDSRQNMPTAAAPRAAAPPARSAAPRAASPPPRAAAPSPARQPAQRSAPQQQSSPPAGARPGGGSDEQRHR